ILEQMMKEDLQIKEEYEKNKKLKNDPRVTKIGEFLRRTSLDEFPQFINVFKGEMSFVGPRPYL
ncbi:sugar transferase, partial [Fusobacterium varium]